MRKLVCALVLAFAFTLVFVACDSAITTADITTGAVTTDAVVTTTVEATTTALNTDESLPTSGMVSLTEALAVGKSISAGAVSEGEFVVTGYIVKIDGATVTLSDNGVSLSCDMGNSTYEEIRMGYLVTLQGKLENRAGTVYFVDFTVENMSAAKYIVSTLLSDKGSVSVSKAKDIAYGETVTVTVTANAGFTVSEILVNGVSLSKTASCTLIVTENLSIEVVYAIDESAAKPDDGNGGDNNDNDNNGGTVTEKTTLTYTFADYEAGVQYGIETHKLDDLLTIDTSDCHFTEQLRVYQSNSNDGIAILKAQAPITALGFNMGYKSAELEVYGSKDGVSYEKLGTITVTSSYADYTLALPEGYSCIKLDAVGAQIRIKTITVTYH